MQSPPSGHTHLRVSTRFVLRGVWIVPSALGQEYNWNFDGTRATLILPRSQDEFWEEGDETEVKHVPSWVNTARIVDSGEAVSVQLIKIDVDFLGDISHADRSAALRPNEHGNKKAREEFMARAESMWNWGRETAAKIAHAWLSHVRVVSGQPWLGTSVEQPMQYGRSHIIDLDSGTRLMSFGPMRTGTIRSGQLALSLDQLNEIEHMVNTASEPPIAEALLADARFLSQESEVIDIQRAVIIAAAACEIKTKLTIRNRVAPSALEQTNEILGKTSTLTRLLDDRLKDALGVSLKKVDATLFGTIEHLKEVRNSVVHRGEKVDQREGWQLVVAAGELFRWLDTL